MIPRIPRPPGAFDYDGFQTPWLVFVLYGCAVLTGLVGVVGAIKGGMLAPAYLVYSGVITIGVLIAAHVVYNTPFTAGCASGCASCSSNDCTEVEYPVLVENVNSIPQPTTLALFVGGVATFVIGKQVMARAKRPPAASI